MIAKLSRRLYGTDAWKKFRIKDVLAGNKSFPNPKEAKVQGWVRSVRKHKNNIFVDINDGSSCNCLQVVIPSDLFERGISYGASVCVCGEIVQTKLHKPKIELHCSQINVIGQCSDDFPFMKQAQHDVKYLRLFPHLQMKEDAMAVVLRTRNKLEMEIHKYFQDKGFLHVHTPVLTSSDCEGAGETFTVHSDKVSTTTEYVDQFIHAKSDCTNNEATLKPVDEQNYDLRVERNIPETKDFFGKPVYLTVSSQLHLEACALGVGDVYTLNPAFRAEHGISRKHLSEFRMLEVEVAFTQNLDDIVSLMEESIKIFIEATSEKFWMEQGHFYKNLTPERKAAISDAASKDYVKMTYSNAVNILQQHSKQLQTRAPSWGDDINNEHEIFLGKHCNNTPIFITDFPAEAKPFYMFTNQDGKTVRAVDLIFPFCGELAGGSVREHRIELLRHKLDSLGISRQYEWYIDLRRYGNIPHAGYGMGFDRLIRFILGINNIRDAVPFPRAPKSCIL